MDVMVVVSMQPNRDSKLQLSYQYIMLGKDDIAWNIVCYNKKIYLIDVLHMGYSFLSTYIKIISRMYDIYFERFLASNSLSIIVIG